MTETTTAQTMAVLAELVLMATRHNLPMPLYLTASEKNSQLNLTLNNRADLDAWHAVFGGGRLWECEPTASSPTLLVTNMHSGSLLGWSVNLQANVPPPLSPEVLAALGEAARSDAAAVLVAEAVAVLDEPDWSRYGECPVCAAATGAACVLVAIVNMQGNPRTTPHDERPLTVPDKPRCFVDPGGDKWYDAGDGLLSMGLPANEYVQRTRPWVEERYGPLVEVTGVVGALIEQSSLGTPEAVALREQTDDETARRIVARSKEFGAWLERANSSAGQEAAASVDVSAQLRALKQRAQGGEQS